MVKAFEDARADKVKGILLRLNTPGGAYIPSDIIRHQIELTTKANIPVVVSMGSLAASGGYLIASAANRIFAHPVTITGSIGVVALQMAFRSFFDDFLGISFSSIQIPEQSERSVPFLDLPDTHTRRRYKESVDHIYDTFISKVAQGRQRSKSSIEKVAKGRIWSGQQALAHGLVDELGGIRQAKNYLCIILQCKANQRIALDFYPEAEAPMETFGRWINQAKAEQLQMTWQQILQQLRLLAQSYPVFSL
jgi:protease-4